MSLGDKKMAWTLEASRGKGSKKAATKSSSRLLAPSTTHSMTQPPLAPGHSNPTPTHNTTHTGQQEAHQPQEKGKCKGRRMAAAAAQEMLSFGSMWRKAELRQWVEANPGRVNDRDHSGETPLLAAVIYEKSLPLVVWLLDKKGADVNGTNEDGASALHYAVSLDVLTALLNRGADPTIANSHGVRPLMWGAQHGTVDVVARLLQDPRVRGCIDVQDGDGATALHHACYNCSYLDIATPSSAPCFTPAPIRPLPL